MSRTDRWGQATGRALARALARAMDRFLRLRSDRRRIVEGSLRELAYSLSNPEPSALRSALAVGVFDIYLLRAGAPR